MNKEWDPAKMQETLGPFRLLRLVASGESGSIYEAVEPGLPDRLAVRVLPATAAAVCAGMQPRLRDAARAAATVRHPNIVAARDFVCEGGTAFVATAFVDGETLAQYLGRVGRLPVLQALALVAQLLSAMEYAQRNGLVHSAIHPGHLLIARNGQLKVAGYGWVQAVAQTAARPGPFDVLPYMAPELALGRQPDPRSDLYSAAVVAYKLLTGALPFQPEEGREAARPSTPLPARMARPELPLELDAVFHRALACSPDARYQSAGEFGAALGGALGTPLWVGQKVAARAAAADAGVNRDQPPDRSPDPGAPAFDANPSPGWLVRRVGFTLAIGCAALAVWIAGIVGGERSGDGAASPIASQAVGGGVSGDPEPTIESQTRSRAPAPLQTPYVATAAFETQTQAEGDKRDRQEANPANQPGSAAVAVEVTPAPRSGATGNRPPNAGRSAHRPAQRGTRQAHAARAELQCRQDAELVREMCTVLRCATAEFRGHPVCVRLHAEAQVRHQLAESRGAP